MGWHGLCFENTAQKKAPLRGRFSLPFPHGIAGQIFHFRIHCARSIAFFGANFAKVAPSNYDLLTVADIVSTLAAGENVGSANGADKQGGIDFHRIEGYEKENGSFLRSCKKIMRLI